MKTALAESAVEGFEFLLNRIQTQKRLSMTYDQGKEMSDHKKLTLRQYFPKGTDLSGYNQEQLYEVAWQLNTRPRKSMGFKCPAEMFTPVAFDFKQHNASLFALAS
jgi:IS30 family transposase